MSKKKDKGKIGLYDLSTIQKKQLRECELQYNKQIRNLKKEYKKEIKNIELLRSEQDKQTGAAKSKVVKAAVGFVIIVALALLLD